MKNIKDPNFRKKSIIECIVFEYGIPKVGTHMIMDRDPPILLGRCPKNDRIILYGYP